MQIQQAGTPINLSISGIVSKTAGNLIGFYVNSTNAGTLIIHNATTATNAVSGTITPAIGFHAFSPYLTNGCFAEIGGTALNVTLFFAAG